MVEFKSFKDEMPEDNKWVLVTNNIDARDAYGEMSHLWLTTFVIISSQNELGFVTFDAADRKIIGLTHWKYAIESNPK